MRLTTKEMNVFLDTKKQWRGTNNSIQSGEIQSEESFQGAVMKKLKKKTERSL